MCVIELCYAPDNFIDAVDILLLNNKVEKQT